MTWYVVDGMDGSGKTTSSDIIRAHLESRGRKVLEITHPNDSCLFGRRASKYLCIQGKAAKMLSTLYYILDVLCSLRKKRKYGKYYDDVIFVRYIMAVAYLPESACPRAYRFISKVLPMPDVKVFVDVDPETAMERIIGRGERLEVFETVDELDKTRRKMLALTDGWHIIDNTSTRELTEVQTVRILESVAPGDSSDEADPEGDL